VRKEKTVSGLLNHFVQGLEQPHFTVTELMEALHERSFGIILLLMALPNAFMIAAIPGLSYLFGTILIIVSLQMIQRRKEPWLPGFVRRQTFSKKGLKTLLKIVNPYLYRVEKHLKSRWVFLTSRHSERCLGVICLLHGILIALPIPLGNFLPGVALVFLSLGILEKDGLYILIGLLLSLAVFAFFFTVFVSAFKFAQVLLT
jgi:hypothetical protein